MNKSKRINKKGKYIRTSVFFGFILIVLFSLFAVLSLSSWAHRDPEAAAEWTKGLANTKIGECAFSMVVVTWAEQDPQAAAAWVVDLEDDQTKSLVMTVVMFHWVIEDPYVAAQWVEIMPNGEAKVDAFSGLIWGWFTRDPDEAAAWAVDFSKSISDEKVRMGVIAAMASYWSIWDAKALAIWAGGLKDSEKRLPHLYAALRWPEEDLEAAMEWVEGMPEGELKTEILAGINRRIREGEKSDGENDD